MTSFQAGFCRQWSLSKAPSAERALPIKQWLSRSSLIFLLAIFLSPVSGVIEAGVANAQNVRYSARGASDTRLMGARPRKRARMRGRRRIVSKQKKSFFGSLFGSKPSSGKSTKPFQGLKSFFDNFQANPSPASVRASYEKRMREAARRDGMSAKERQQFRPGGDLTGWGPDPMRGSQAAYSRRWGRGQYRTMCVRMCDGYYFPVSFKANSNQLEADAHYCNSNCYNAPTKLFYYSNPGGSIEDMQALDGILYKDIANAFKYRKTYVADCRCKAEPWSAQARQQHESWGLEAQNRQDDANKSLNQSMGEVDMTSAEQAVPKTAHAQY